MLMLRVSGLGWKRADKKTGIQTHYQWNDRKNRNCCNKCKTVSREN